MMPSPTAISPLLLRNIITSIFIHADKSLLNLSKKFKSLELIRYLIVSSFFFFLRVLPSLVPSANHSSAINPLKASKGDRSYSPVTSGGDSGIARALSQLLSLINHIPVSSRKYEVVRSLTEKLIDENHQDGNVALREVNRTVLSLAFDQTLRQLETTVVELGREFHGGEGVLGSGQLQFRLDRVLRVVRSIGSVGRSRVGRSREEEMSWLASSAEKLAAELLWLAHKLVDCECVEEAVCRWASASNLGWLALAAEPRLQCSLVKISAYLFRQAKEMEVEEHNETETRMKLLVTWLPLLCRASNGTDTPVLSVSERIEIEKVLEKTIEMLGKEEQEQVLSSWVYHFTYSSSSDWPNLHASYSRWYNTSRKQLIHQ